MPVGKQLPKNWILIRGLIRSCFHWKTFTESLKSGLQLESVQTVELPGNGYLYQEQTPNDIQQVITQLKSQLSYSSREPVGLFGISLGGMLATKWAQLHPQEVSHLVLINSSSQLSPFQLRLLPQNYLSIIRHLAFSKPAQIEKFILTTTSNDKNRWQPELQENIEFLKEHPVSLMNFIRQLNLTSQVDFRQIPQTQKMILTSKADQLVSSICSEQIAAQWGCDIFYHKTAGHDLPLDDASWVIEKLKNFKY